MNEHKKILYLITKSEWGGAGKYVLELAAAAREKGYGVAVAAGGNGPLIGMLKNSSIPFFSLGRLKREVGPFGALAVFFKTLGLLFSFKPDVIHASSPQAAGIGGAAAFFWKFASSKPIKTIFTVHGWSFLEDRPQWQKSFIRLLSKMTLWFYDRAVCVSENDRRAAISWRVGPAQKITTIHNGVSEDQISFFSKEEARAGLPSIKVAPDEFVAVTIGEFVKNKGYKYLINAGRLLKARGTEIKIVIIAWGKDYEKTKKEIEDARLTDSVILIKDLQPAAPYLKAFDVFVFPSLKEGLPYAILEAGIARLPVAATEVGGIPEIIENEKSGLLVPAKNAEALAQAIEKLKNEKELRTALARNLYKKVNAEFSKKEMLEKTFALYDQVSSSRNDA